MKSFHKFINRFGGICICLALSLSASLVLGQVKEQPRKEETGINFYEGKWADVVADAKKSGKYIFVDAYTSWCGPCKLLKTSTFKEKQVATYFNGNYINYAVDMEKGAGVGLAERWEVTAYPTLLFFSPSGKLLMRQVGFVNGDALIAFGEQARSRR